MTSLMEQWDNSMKRGTQFLDLYQLPEAEKCFEDALVIAQRFLNNKSLEMQTLAFLGHTYSRGNNPWSDFPSPIEYYKKAAEIARDLRNYEWESALYIDISDFCANNNDGENALNWAQHALTVAVLFGYSYGQVMAWNTIGFAYNRLAKASRDRVNYRRHNRVSKASKEFKFFEKEYEYYQKEYESFENAVIIAQKLDKQLLSKNRRRIIENLIFDLAKNNITFLIASRDTTYPRAVTPI